jgi:ATP-dependent helicase/nuclease subunit A
MECLALDPEVDAQAIALGCGLGAADARQCSEQARSLMASARARQFFDERGYVRAFNELPLVNEDGELRRIDRVVEFFDVVWVLDYKTGRYDQIAGTAIESEYREQVAGYCRSLALVYAGKPVRGALIFAGGTLIEVAN